MLYSLVFPKTIVGVGYDARNLLISMIFKAAAISKVFYCIEQMGVKQMRVKGSEPLKEIV